MNDGENRGECFFFPIREVVQGQMFALFGFGSPEIFLELMVRTSVQSSGFPHHG